MAITIKKCPKCLHVRRPEEAANPECCPACGLYFEKWAARAVHVRRAGQAEMAEETGPSGWGAGLRERLCSIRGRGDAVQFHSRACMLALLTWWGIRLARMDYRDGEMAGSFMHTILLPIHEAGHILFIPFGEFMTILGGSFFQLLLPLIVAVTILWQNRDPFGAALGVWWCGISWMDLAAYIYDAKVPQLTLLGGHTGEDGPHDWIYLLGVFGKIRLSQTYGLVAHRIGVLIMLAAIAAAALVLWRMWKVRNDPVDRFERAFDNQLD